MIALLQYSSTSHNYHDYLKVMEKGLAKASASSLSTCGCTSLDPKEFFTPSFLTYSLNRSSSIKDKSSLLLTFCLMSKSLDFCRIVLTIKTEVKRASSTSACIPSRHINTKTQKHSFTPQIHISTHDRPHRVTRAHTFNTHTDTNSSNGVILLPSLAE